VIRNRILLIDVRWSSHNATDILDRFVAILKVLFNVIFPACSWFIYRKNKTWSIVFPASAVYCWRNHRTRV